MSYWAGFTAVLMAGLALFTAPFWLLRRGGRRPGRGQALLENGALALLALFLVLLLLELAFKLFFAQSDGFRYTLASRNWYNRYWRENSLGYRDVEWTPELIQGRVKVLVLGDSFVAGHGLADPEDRFSNVLGRLLGPGYAVMNIGRNGASTRDEIKYGMAYPYPADIVILSFYLNDIEETAAALGFRRPELATRPGGLIDHSYALNFLYWRLNRLLYQAESARYWQWLLGLYDRPEVWPVYEQELIEIARFLDDRERQLLVVVFPALPAIEDSRPVTGRIVELYEGQGVPVVDVAGLVQDMPPDELVVSAVDAHPNAFVNRLVAEELYRLMTTGPAAIQATVPNEP